MEIDDSNLSDGSIDFEMIDVNEDDLEEDLFNFKLNPDNEGSEGLEEDSSDDDDVDGHIGSDDEYVSVEDNMVSGHQELNEELSNDEDDESDDGEEERQSKRQKIKEPGIYSRDILLTYYSFKILT